MTRKTTRAVARIVAGLDDKLYLGNLESKRDWGHAKDYVRAMWMMLQQDEPEDFVIGTGPSLSVSQFVDFAFSYVGLDWRDFVEIDSKYFRPTEVEYLLADSTRARERLGWEPTITLHDLVCEMMDADLASVGLTLDAAKERAAELRQTEDE